jgi:hypothetical protein
VSRYAGTTAQRGLGAEHQADRKRLLKQLRDGDPCWRCGQPMYKSQPLDRDHVIDRALGGAQGPAMLAHRWCNRAAGARLGNQMHSRTITAAGRDTICAICAKPYSRAARACEICGAHYHPNHGGQRSCSRACGIQLRKRIYGPSGSSRVAAPKLPPRERPVRAPATLVAYYTCRYCGTLGVQRASSQPGHGRREVCEARECQMRRLRVNNLIARNGMTREQAEAAAAYRTEGGGDRRRPAATAARTQAAAHRCPGCDTATVNYRWCDACLCTDVNANGKRCGNVASTGGRCEYHAQDGSRLAASRSW